MGCVLPGLSLLVCLSLVGAQTPTSQGAQAAAKMLSGNIDTTMKPCTDFYKFACGNVLKNPPSGSNSISGNLNNQVLNVLNQLGTVMSKVNVPSSGLPRSVQAAAKFYQICTSASANEAKQLLSAIKVLKVNGWPMITPNWTPPNGKAQVELLAGKLLGLYNVPTFFQSSVINNLVGNANYSLITTQPPLPMGSRQLYIDPKYSGARTSYLNMIVKISKALRSMNSASANVTDAQIMADANAILNLEIKMASRMRPRAEMRNFKGNYMTIDYLGMLIRWPGINFLAYFEGLLENFNGAFLTNGLTLDGPVFSFANTGFIHEMRWFIGNPAKSRIAFNYMIWRLVYKNAMYIPNSSIRQAYEQFHTEINGVSALPPVSQNCAAMVMNLMPYAAGYIYANNNFPGGQNAIQDVSNIFGKVKTALAFQMQNTPWFDMQTQSNFQTKLGTISATIGYNQWMMNPTQLDQYYNNPIYATLASNQTLGFFESSRQLIFAYQTLNFGRLGKPINPNDLPLSPAAVSSWYETFRNRVTVPMGIMNPPIYRTDFPRVINYGGMGATVGHQMSHAFDDMGTQVDANGLLNSVFSISTGLKFAQKAQCLKSQYSSNCYRNAQNQCVNGAVTVGQNIADLNGLMAAYKAYSGWVSMNGQESPLPGLKYNWKQLFFLQYANMWCQSQTNQSLTNQLLMNSHSPNSLRVNGVVKNMPQFQQAFQCPIGSSMAPNANQQCHIYGPVTKPTSVPAPPPTKPLPTSNTVAWNKPAMYLRSNLNTSINPCNDFYTFSCGGWQARNPRNGQRSVNVFQQMREKTDQAIGIAMRDIHPTNHNLPKTLIAAVTYFNSCISWVNHPPANDYISVVNSLRYLNLGGWPAVTPNWARPQKLTSWWNAVGKLEFQSLVPSLLSTNVDVDWKHVAKNSIYINQGSLGMFNPNFYTQSQYSTQQNQYKGLIRAAIMVLSLKTNVTMNLNQINQDVQAIYNFEATVASFVRPLADEENNIAGLYNAFNFTQVTQRWPFINWEDYIQNLGIHVNLANIGKEIIFTNPSYVSQIHQLLTHTSDRTIANYLGWRLVLANFEFLGKLNGGFKSIDFLSGGVDGQRRSLSYGQQRCVDHLSMYMPLAAGRIYVGTMQNTAVPRRDVSFLVQRSVAAWSQIIQDLPWMDMATKNLALAKINGLKQNIGFPDWLMNNMTLDQYHSGYWNTTYNPFALNSTYPYYKLYANLKINFLKTILKEVNQRGSRNTYFGSPAGTRAAYSLARNALTLPYALMQSPLYGVSSPQSFNFGGLGTFAARELSHAFDNIGANFFTNGTLYKWMSAQSSAAFQKEQQCLVNQYKVCFPSQGNKCINGQRTLFENIAEIAGIRSALYAYEKYQTFFGREASVPGLEEMSNEQLFFTSYAQQYCQNASPSEIQNELTSGIAPPHKYRVNFALQDIPQFQKAFHCPNSAFMSQQKCKVWA